MDEVITVDLRVESCVIKPSVYAKTGDFLEVRASGAWMPHTGPDELPKYPIDYPVSLHMTVYPGCGAIPVIGDHIKITVERSN